MLTHWTFLHNLPPLDWKFMFGTCWQCTQEKFRKFLCSKVYWILTKAFLTLSPPILNLGEDDSVKNLHRILNDVHDKAQNTSAQSHLGSCQWRMLRWKLSISSLIERKFLVLMSHVGFCLRQFVRRKLKIAHVLKTSCREKIIIQIFCFDQTFT